YDIIVDSNNGFVPVISTNEDPAFGFSLMEIAPREFSAYVQDKIELNDMTINVGLRYDLFDPNYLVPELWYLADEEFVPDVNNPSDSVSNRVDASLKSQLSPRVGLAFPISETGVVRFSYGMFFQVPSFNGMYSNPEYFVDDGGNGGFGNPNIDPEQTSTFEIGIQQGITEDIGIDVTLYTKDVRNLTATIIEFNPEGAGTIRRQENRDYGTVRGVTVSLYQRPRGIVQWNLDYTLQFADGSAFLSGESFERQRAGLEDINTLARLDWDRTHVLNNIITIQPRKEFSFTLVNRLNSGRPYTTERSDVVSYIPNDGTRPTSIITDLRMFYSLPVIDAQLVLQIQNMFDTDVPVTVYSDSGRGDYTVDEFREAQTGTVAGLNTLDDWFTRQEFLTAPRRVSFGLTINF
ncbi:MAG: TonB-dependent receptor, partial [Balneolales bacterium]|nr:TonB-dependent receptor [Balneolales bacterium]